MTTIGAVDLLDHYLVLQGGLPPIIGSDLFTRILLQIKWHAFLLLIKPHECQPIEFFLFFQSDTSEIFDH